jgi:type VI secretion system secreted protein VgrG
MSVPDIVKRVLSEGGVPEGDQVWTLSQSYEPRPQCSQYRETDFAFVSRLLAEEGIVFSITHDEGSDKVLFTDDDKGFGDIKPSTVPFDGLQGFDILKPQVMWLSRRHAVKTDKVFLRDYDFTRPKYQLQTELEGTDEGPHALEVYRYPGRFVDEGAGGRHAKALLHSMQAERDVLSGETSLMSFKTGHRFTIEEHPYEGFNQEWMVVSIETEARTTASFHEGDVKRDFLCRFTAVPTASTVYKAPRREAMATVPGTQSAFVTGAAGSEIHPDEHGRIKARFLWDRTDPQDDTSSFWIRTEQPNTPDSMFLPRVGWEVSLRYFDGDVDRPMCFGRLYNALAPPPYKLPDGKARSSIQTATSPGGGSSNELRMDDSGGSEEMFVNASKDLTIKVGNNMSMTIGNNEVRTIGANSSLAVTNTLETVVGANQSLMVGANQEMKVETFMLDDVGADHSLKIGGNRDMKVGGDHKFAVGGSQTKSVGGMQVDLVVGTVQEKVDGSMTHEVGAALIELVTNNRDFTVAGSRTENVGAAKVVVTKGGRGVEIGGSLTTMVAGAIVNKVKGDKSQKAGGPYTDLVAGAQIIKADNVTFEGESLVAVVMGASVLIVSKPAILLAGTSVKWDGETKDTAILIVDN